MPNALDDGSDRYQTSELEWEEKKIALDLIVAILNWQDLGWSEKYPKYKSHLQLFHKLFYNSKLPFSENFQSHF